MPLKDTFEWAEKANRKKLIVTNLKNLFGKWLHLIIIYFGRYAVKKAINIIYLLHLNSRVFLLCHLIYLLPFTIPFSLTTYPNREYLSPTTDGTLCVLSIHIKKKQKTKNLKKYICKQVYGFTCLMLYKEWGSSKTIVRTDRCKARFHWDIHYKLRPTNACVCPASFSELGLR